MHVLWYTPVMTDDTHTDVEFEMEDEQGVGALKEKIAKLKAELAVAKSERQEYFDGLQRSRADAANLARESREAFSKAEKRARESITEELLVVLDGFDMAMGGTTWETVSLEWRRGIEYIHSQLLTVLSQNGIERYGKVGDVFDHAQHEALEEVEVEGTVSGVITRIVRSGYKMGDRVIRPAQVTVSK